MSFAHPNDLKVEVGGITTLVFRVSAPGPYTKVLIPAVELPSGWLAVSELAPIEVSDSEPVVGFLTLRVPRSASAGSYRVGLAFSGQGDGGLTGQASMSLLVPSVSEIGLSIASPTIYVRGGEPVRIPISVTNRGNGSTAIHIDATGPIEAEMRLDSTRIQLGPRLTRVVQLHVVTEQDISQETIQEFYIHARGERDPSTFSSVTARVHVIPGYGQLNQSLKTQPLELTLQSVGDESGGGAQVGAKSRFQALGGVMDLNMMLADRSKTPMFGSRETYRLSYTSESLVLRLGDQTQYLSPLSTHGDYGSGAGLEIKQKKFNVKGFAQRSRHQFPVQGIAGGAIGYRPSPKLGLSLNAITRDGPYEGSFVSARGELNPFGPVHNLDLECGLDSGSGTENPSCSAIVGGSLGGLTYNGRYSSTSETYPGYQQGQTQQYARLSYRLPLGISVEGSMRNQEASYLGSSTRVTDFRQLGGTWNLRFGGVRSFSRLFYIMRTWDYTSGDLLIDRSENTLRLQQGINTGRVDLNGTIDLGRGQSSARNYNGTGHRYQATVRYTPGRRLSLSATGEVAEGYLNGSTRSTDRRMMNLQARAKLGSLTDISLTYYRNEIRSIETLRYSSYRASLRRQFRNGQEVRFQAQVSVVPNSKPAQTSDYQLSYSLPLSVPVGRHSDQVAVAGRIYDAESGEGLSGVLLFLGPNATISDENGRFEILRPVDYSAFLSLDYRSIGLESVPLIPMPHEVAQGAEVGLLEIPIARSAQVDGNITVFGSPTGELLMGDQTDEQVPLSGLGNVILSLSNSLNEYRTRTSAAGHYEFRSIVPGDYLLRVVVHPKLDNHRFVTDTLSVSVRGGQRKGADLSVVPNRPKIRLLNAGSPDITLAPVRVKKTEPVKQNREGPVLAADTRRNATPETTPEWSDIPVGKYSIQVPFSSRAYADRVANRVSDHITPGQITSRPTWSTDSMSSRPLPGEGVENLLKRHGLKFTPEAIAEFHRLNPEVVNDPYGLRRSLEYVLPMHMPGPQRPYAQSLGQFNSFDEAVEAMRGLERRLPYAAYVVLR